MVGFFSLGQGVGPVLCRSAPAACFLDINYCCAYLLLIGQTHTENRGLATAFLIVQPTRPLLARYKLQACVALDTIRLLSISNTDTPMSSLKPPIHLFPQSLQSFQRYLLKMTNPALFTTRYCRYRLHGRLAGR